MTLHGRYRGVVDRIEEGTGVILVEEEDEVVDEVHVDAAALPRGADEGDELALRFEVGELRTLLGVPGSAERRREELQDRFDSLSERPPGRDEESADGDGDEDE